MKQKLDPRAVWLFFIKFILRFLIALIIISTLLGIWTRVLLSAIGRTESKFFLDFLNRLYAVMPSPWVLVPGFLVIAFILAKLTYHFYRYEMTDDGFRKELGIIWKKYVTIPYDKIQNVDIYRGAAARMLGLSDVHIQTAGTNTRYPHYGAWGLSAEGRLPGLSREVAEKLRDELIRRVKGSQR